MSFATMLTLLLVCAFSPRKYKSILRGFYNAVSLPGDASHTALLKSHCRGRQCSLFCLYAPFPPRRQKHRIIAFAARQNIVSTLSFSFFLTSPGFSGILALRVSRTVASQDEESPSITRQGAGEIPVKATSRKVQQRYTARFIV